MWCSGLCDMVWFSAICVMILGSGIIDSYFYMDTLIYPYVYMANDIFILECWLCINAVAHGTCEVVPLVYTLLDTLLFRAVLHS